MRKRLIGIGRGVIAKEPNYVFYGLRFLSGLGYGLIAPVYVLLLFSLGLDAYQVSITNLFFVLGNVVLNLPAGSLADNWGRKKTFLISSLFTSGSFLSFVLIKTWPLIIVAEILSAIGYVLMVGVLEAWVVDAWKEKSAKPEDYGFLFTRAETAGFLANLIGGISGGLLGSFSLRLPFLIGGFFNFLILPIGYLLMKEKWIKKETNLKLLAINSFKTLKAGTKESFKNKFIWQIALSAGMSMVGLRIIDVFWSKRFVDMTFQKVETAGYLWTMITVFMIIGNFLWQKWINKTGDYLRGLMFNSLFAGLMIILSSINKNFYLAAGFFIFYEMARGLQRPALFGYFNNFIPSQKRATILSFVITATWLGGAIGLITLGWVARKFSIEISWIMAAIILLFSITPILFLKKK